VPFVEDHVLDHIKVNGGEQPHYLVDVGSFGIQEILVAACETREEAAKHESKDVIAAQNWKGAQAAAIKATL